MKDKEYIEQEVITYHANPFIEKLPPILTKAEFFKKMTCLPLYDNTFRNAPDHVRAHLIADGFDFFLALPRHYSLHTCRDRMMRRGYLARNPIPEPLYWRLMEERLTKVKADLESISALSQRSFRRLLTSSSDLTSALIGVTGGGKSLTVRMDLAHIPQLHEHGEYHGHSLNVRQVTWLWVEASHKSSPNDLCLSIFRAFDAILNTNYEDTYGRGTLAVMMGRVTRLASLHALGLLVIDEIQEISNIKSGGDKALIGFLLRLANTIKIPVLMIGTYKAGAILGQQMRHIRRSTGIGIPPWEPLDRVGREWETFLRALWRYQYTKTETPLTPDLSDLLYDESQGIPDFAVKLYFLSQDRLIATNNGSGKEKITTRIIKSVATEYLSPARDLLQALRYKDKERLKQLDDVKLPTLEEILEQRARNVAEAMGFSNEFAGATTEPSLTITAASPNAESGPKPDRKSAVVNGKPELESKLKSIIGSNVSNPDAAYNALAAAGYIKSAGEFAMEVTP